MPPVRPLPARKPPIPSAKPSLRAGQHRKTRDFIPKSRAELEGNLFRPHCPLFAARSPRPASPQDQINQRFANDRGSELTNFDFLSRISSFFLEALSEASMAMGKQRY